MESPNPFKHFSSLRISPFCLRHNKHPSLPIFHVPSEDVLTHHPFQLHQRAFVYQFGFLWVHRERLRDIPHS
jgi:hypothetical protein